MASSIRNHIDLILETFAEPAEFGSNRSRGTLPEIKQRTLDQLDQLLSCQMCTKGEKLKSLREVEAAAKRMADQIERFIQQRVSGYEA